MKKKQKPQFFAMYKDFNTGEVKPYEVLHVVFNGLLTSRGYLRKDACIYDKKWNKIPVRTKEHLQEFIETEFRYHYWGKCEWEFIAIDWPYRDTIEESRPVKVDVYDILKPNIPIITDLVWDYIEPKIQKLTGKKKVKKNE